MHDVYKYNFRKTSACFVLSGSSVLSIVSDVANKYYLSSIRLHSSHMSILFTQ